MSYTACHPDLFETALSFSGAPDIAYNSEAQVLATPIINATEVFLDRAPLDAMFGSRLTDEINWATHDIGAAAAIRSRSDHRPRASAPGGTAG